MNIVIRKAKMNDLKDLMQLDKEAAKEIRWWFHINSSTFLRRINKGLVYVAEKDKEIIGFQNGNVKYDGLMLEDVYVKNNFRKAGVAESLIKKFIFDWKSKFNIFFLHCPKRLKRFYEKFGFKQTAIIMVKKM